MTLTALLEDPRVFHFTQKLNPMTVGLYRELVETHVARPEVRSVLDIGCGVGAHRPLFDRGLYTGIDINPAYVAMANQVYGGGFRVMDAGQLDFPPGTFGAVFTAATCHHLDDATLLAMANEAMRVLAASGAFHVIDPVIPVSPRAFVKRALFANDRGRHQRTVRQLTQLLGQAGRVQSVDVRSGILHDVCYVRVTA